MYLLKKVQQDDLRKQRDYIFRIKNTRPYEALRQVPESFLLIDGKLSSIRKNYNNIF